MSHSDEYRVLKIALEHGFPLDIIEQLWDRWQNGSQMSFESNKDPNVQDLFSYIIIKFATMNNTSNVTSEQIQKAIGILEFLLAHGADINGHDANGLTPLNKLIKEIHSGYGNVSKAYQTLIELGANPDIPDSASRDARAMASAANNSYANKFLDQYYLSQHQEFKTKYQQMEAKYDQMEERMNQMMEWMQQAQLNPPPGEFGYPHKKPKGYGTTSEGME